MARKVSKATISELMSRWGCKGGSRATEAQRNAARENLKKTPNYQKHASSAKRQENQAEIKEKGTN